jgi:MoaA/NifB/PqqE/SkfB family radical SAM enzyme
MGKKKLIKEVLEELDFERIEYVMNYLNWRWRRDEVSKVPSVDELKAEVKRLCELACSSAVEHRRTVTPDYIGPYTVGSGGFEVKAYLTEDDGKVEGIVVNFILEEWSTFK